jgi:hypothetical protein
MLMHYWDECGILLMTFSDTRIYGLGFFNHFYHTQEHISPARKALFVTSVMDCVIQSRRYVGICVPACPGSDWKSEDRRFLRRQTLSSSPQTQQNKVLTGCAIISNVVNFISLVLRKKLRKWWGPVLPPRNLEPNTPPNTYMHTW